MFRKLMNTVFTAMLAIGVWAIASNYADASTNKDTLYSLVAERDGQQFVLDYDTRCSCAEGSISMGSATHDGSVRPSGMCPNSGH